MQTSNSAIYTKNYITKDYLTTEMGLVFDNNDDALPFIANAIYYASRRVNTITGNLIDKNAASGTNILANFTDYQQSCIQRATGEYTKWFLANGLTFLRGSTSGNLGSQLNYSQSNPDQPDYIPQDVLTELQNAGLYQFIKTTNIDNRTGNSYGCNNGADMSGIPWGYTLISAQELDAEYVRINGGITSSDNSINVNVVQGKVDLKAKGGGDWTSPDASIRIDNTAKTLMVATDIEEQLETIGIVANLTTKNKQDLVSAVNEVNAKSAGKTYTSGTGINVDNTANTIALDTSTQTTLTQVGTNTTNITSLVTKTDTTNTNVTALQTKVGTATLNTTAKDLSGAVNELNSKPTGKIYTPGDTTISIDNTGNTIKVGDTFKQSVVNNTTAISTLQTNQGNLSTLTTTDKTTLVKAINEVDADATKAITNIGDITTLTTTDKTSTVAAINEINAKPAGNIYPQLKSDILAGANITISQDDVNKTITISSTGGGTGGSGISYIDITAACAYALSGNKTVSSYTFDTSKNYRFFFSDVFITELKGGSNFEAFDYFSISDSDAIQGASFSGNLNNLQLLQYNAGSSTPVATAVGVSKIKVFEVVPGGSPTPTDIYAENKREFVGGTNVTITTNDAARTLTIDAPQRTYTAADNSLVFNQASSSIAVSSDIQTKVGTIGAVNTLKTNVKTDTVSAINETYTAAEQAINNVGQLSALTTTAKSSTVAAINEVNSKPVGKTYTGQAGVDVDNTANTIGLDQHTQDIISQAQADHQQVLDNRDHIGDVSTLNTQAKIVVEAINEVNTNVGPLTSLTTSDKTNIVDAINEVNAKVGPSLGDAKFTEIPGTPTGVRLSNTNDDNSTGLTLYGDGGKVLSVPSGKLLFVSANADAGLGANGQALTKGFSLSEAGGMVLTGINLTGLSTPTVDNQAANKAYVDSKVGPGGDIYPQVKTIVNGSPTVAVIADDTGKTLTLSAPQIAINSNNIGTMTALTTQNKTTLVNAINEINAKPSGAGKDWVPFQTQAQWTYDTTNKKWNANTPLTTGLYKISIYYNQGSEQYIYTTLLEVLENQTNQSPIVLLRQIVDRYQTFYTIQPNQIVSYQKTFTGDNDPVILDDIRNFNIEKYQYPI